MREPDKSRKSAWWRMRSRLGRDLVRDENGGVLLYMTILIPVMMGVIGLAVDGSRLYILNTEQSHLVDAAALAGARELNGEYIDVDDNAIVRATNAVHNAVANAPRWGSDAQPEFHISQIRFCGSLTETLPRECVDPILETETAKSDEARFIEVTAETRLIVPSFLMAVGAVSSAATDSRAIAGASVVACKVQPLMLCNPLENPDPTKSKPFSAEAGQMFHFKQKQKSTGKDKDGNANETWYSPGNFGLIDPPGQDSSTGPELRQLLSQQDPNFCYINDVSPRPGQSVGNVTGAINVRFDLPPGGNTTGMDLTPAPNVLKGMRSSHPTDQCNFQGGNLTDTPAARLPRDIDITTVAGVETVGIGSGVMDPTAMNDYWEYHHGDVWPTHIDTRFEAYMFELGMDTDGKDHAMGSPPLTGDEKLAPQCTTPAADYKRRLISVSIVNCLHEKVQGNKSTNVRSETYAEFFITEPSDGGEIFTEFVRMFTPETHDTKIKRIVQLYR